MNLLLSVDRTEEVYNTIKYEHEIIPKQKLLDNFFAINFEEVLKYEIDEIFLFNHRNIVITKQDYIDELNKKNRVKEDVYEAVENLVQRINILNRNRFHLINRKQDFVNVIKAKNVILLEDYLDEFMTFFIHRNYLLINKLIILDNNYKLLQNDEKSILKEIWNSIEKRSKCDNSFSQFEKYFQKFLIDFLSDNFIVKRINLMMDTNINKSPYYIYGRDNELIFSLLAKIYNDFYDDKEYVELSNDQEFRIPLSKNIFILLKDKIDENTLINRITNELFHDKKIFIFNFSKNFYPKLENYISLFIPKLSELDSIFHNLFTYLLIISNSNNKKIIELLIDLEGYPDFYNDLKSFPQIRDIKNFVVSNKLKSENLTSVAGLKIQLTDLYNRRIGNNINKIEWSGKKILIKFIDYEYLLDTSKGLLVMVFLLENPGRWNPEDLYVKIFNRLKIPKDPWDSMRKSYDNFLEFLSNYEKSESFRLHSLHNYLTVNEIVEFKSKGDPLVISNSDPSKWEINI